MEKINEAISIFEDGFNCAQAVLSVYSNDLLIDRELALKIASGFGGGSRNGELCGAVSGAIMVLGLKDGHYIKGDNELKHRSYRLAKEFTDRFREVHGDIVCKNLLGYDLSIPEEYKILEEKGMFKTECPKFISTAVSILETMLENKD